MAIGGGTGMPQLLRGLRTYTDNITAIVTVADDGGSSGRLRSQMGVLPPGDFRNNIAALSDAEELMTRLFQYRFPKQDLHGNDNELAGHSFGNLFIATMAAITGSFETGLAECARVLAVRGRVLPSTLEHVVLCAEIVRRQVDGSEGWLIVEGESNLPNAKGQIQRVFLKPDQPRAYPAVIRSILQADLIVAGPGSFFTSVMPNLLVPAIRDAICATTVPRIYLCNVATQPGETDGYSVSDHMQKLREHAGDAFTTVLANANYDPAQPPYTIGEWVTLPPKYAVSLSAVYG
ncbi:MAG: YvcK family protein [Caldilineaceae bacterium]